MKMKIKTLTKSGMLAVCAAVLMSGCGATSSERSETIKVETLPEETQAKSKETQSETVNQLSLMVQLNDRIDYAYLEKALTYLADRYDDVHYLENTPAYEDQEDSLLKTYLERALMMRAMKDSLTVSEDGSSLPIEPQLISDDKLIAVENEETMPEGEDMPYAYYQSDCLDDFMTLIGSTQSVIDLGISRRPEITDQIAVPSSGFGGGEDARVEMHSLRVRADGIYVYYKFIVTGQGDASSEDMLSEERAAKIIPDNTGSLGYKIEWIKLADEVPAAADVFDQAEPESVDESHGAIEVVSVSELVEPAREETVDYTDNAGNSYHAVFRIPRIKIASEDAVQINAEILDKLNARVDEALADADNGYSLITTGIDYNAWVWNDTLTVFTSVKTNWDLEMHYIYTLDMKDGHRMDNAQIAALWGRTEDELYAALTDLIREKFISMYGEADEADGDFYEEQLANSISEENVDNSVLYPDSKGSAMADVKIYALAGADAYRHIIGLGWE